jgi:hypothetical protein
MERGAVHARRKDCKDEKEERQAEGKKEKQIHVKLF